MRLPVLPPFARAAVARPWLFLALCVLFGQAGTPAAQAARLQMEISGAAFRPFPVAAPSWSTADKKDESLGQQAKALHTALCNGLTLARSLELVPARTYLAAEHEAPTQPNFKTWTQTGASGLVHGMVSAAGEQVRLDLYFYDVEQSRQVLHNVCSKGPAQARRCVHKFLDDVIVYLTGEQGIFSSKLAFVRRVGRTKQVFTCDIDGGSLRQVSGAAALNLLPSWEPSGEALLLTSYLRGNADLYRLHLGNRSMEVLSHSPGLNTGASVSPDGQRIALTLSKDGNTEIYVMDAGGKNLRRLTDSWGQDVSPTWSPDGQRIAFVSSRSGNPHIYVMQADGSAPRRLTFQGTYNQEPDWSPRADGQIAFTARDETLKYDVFLVHPDSGVVTRLTQNDGHNESPTHSPDGHHLVFTSSRGPSHKKELWVMDVDGNAQRPVGLSSGDYETPSWGPRLGYGD